MRTQETHAHSTGRSQPTVIERPRDLPADVLTTREVEWLGELKARYAAVQAWRGLAHHAPMRDARSFS